MQEIKSSNSLVLTADIILNDTMTIPEGLQDVKVRSDTPGRRLSGDGTFRLIRVKSSELTIENLVLIHGFDDDSSGGAVRVSNNGNLRARSCVFIKNRAAFNGGAVSAVSGTLYFEDCRFENNEAMAGSE